MARQNRNHFFGPTGTDHTRFSTGNKPTQERFMELFMSVPFFKELESMARKRVPGLLALPSKSDLMTLMGKYNNIPLVVTPEMLPFIGPNWTDMPIAPAIYDSEARYTTDPLFNPVSNTANGITVKQAYLGDLGNSIFAILMAINESHFEYTRDGKLQLKENGSYISADMLEQLPFRLLSGLKAGEIIIGGAVNEEIGNTETLELAERTLFFRNRDLNGSPTFALINLDDGDVIESKNKFIIANNKVSKNHLARRAEGSILFGSGTESDLSEAFLNSQGKMLMGLSNGNAGVVTLGGVMSIDDNGNLNYKVNTIYGKHLHSSFIHQGIELIDLGEGEKAIATKVQKSIEKNSSGIQLKNDATSPGNYKYYGTNELGEKGYNTLPIGVFTQGTGVDSVKQNSAEGATKKHAIATGNGLSKWRGSEVRSIDDNQNASKIKLIYIGNTSDDSSKEISIAGEASEFFDKLPENCLLNVEAKITAFNSSNMDSYTSLSNSAFKTINGIMSEVGSEVLVSKINDASMDTLMLKISEDNLNHRLSISVRGLASVNIQWMITLDIDLLKF